MRKIYILIFLISVSVLHSFGQNQKQDTLDVQFKDVIVTANKTQTLLLNNPGAISLVTPEALSIMPRSTAVEEALRFVPGVRIDNQHNGERVHLSIRGQGILTERGLRGIGVLLDGIPVNDPSGFAPDLYDVDWSTVDKIEVVRGPIAGLYGGGGSAGLLNITTNDGTNDAEGLKFQQTYGSNNYSKSFFQIGGSKEDLSGRVSFSRTGGDGYRDHQGFWSNKLYEKINFTPLKNVSITQIFSHTDYFQQNPEGLNLSQLDNPLQANPDANPFNEYQKTNRSTFALIASAKFNESNDIQGYYFLRNWNYKETSNKAAEYRTYLTPGASVQYNFHLKTSETQHHFSVGEDLKIQNIEMYKLMSGSNPNRVDNIDETNIELDTLLANQIISQSDVGFFGLYNFVYKKLNFMANVRYDMMKNELTDKMLPSDSSKTTKDFSHTSVRLGLSYSFTNEIAAFTNWSQGFLPPSTEELASNPLGYNGFNTHLVPATSNCIDLGFRGVISNDLYYEVSGFYMTTENDFFRFKQSGRGNQEVFYGNAGNSERYGIETYFDYKILNNLSLQLSYTYSHFTYTSATIDPIYTDTNFVLTTPPTAGQFLPNSPEHQLYTEIVYKPINNVRLSFGAQYQSKWAIYTDAKVYSGNADPSIYKNWQAGFTLLNVSVTYFWKLWDLTGEISIYGRNLTNESYMAFTEPDPDGNSYQPGPKSEFFGNIKINF